MAEDALPRLRGQNPCCSMHETGLVTALMRFAPGAVLPDHEHVEIEQTYVREGKLVDKDGPAAGLEVGPGRVRLARARQPPRRMVSRGRADAGDVPGPQQILRGATAASPTPQARTGMRHGGMR